MKAVVNGGGYRLREGKWTGGGKEVAAALMVTYCEENDPIRHCL